MHWEKRNRERKLEAHERSFQRLPGWRDKPSPISFKKWPVHHAVHDNCGAAVQKKRKARITLSVLSIQRKP